MSMTDGTTSSHGEIRWPTPGETILHGANRYVVGHVLGSGGYGIAYECQDQWGNALVLKVLVPRGQTYDQVRQNWEREISSLLTLRHPNVTYVYDAFELSSTFHIVVERCGGTLADLLTAPGYDGEAWIVPIARCVLQGIAYIHDAGYVHKDIHLRNVFWTHLNDEVVSSNSPSAVFKVGDLGIARLAWDVDVYRPTVPWMQAPEAIDPGRFGPPGQITDIYNLGLVLLAMLLGVEPPYTPADIVSGVPYQTALRFRPPWGPAIAAALRPQASDRIRTVCEFWAVFSGDSGEA